MKTIRTLGVLAVAGTVALGGCSTLSRVGDLNPFRSRKPASAAAQGNRIAIIALDQQLKVSDALKGQDFLLPPPAPLAEWPLPGGTPEQSVEHVEAAPAFEVAWRKGYGAGSSRRAHVTAPPVMADGKVFVMDGKATVSAIDARTGDTVWRTNIEPKSKRDKEGFGGGVAYADGKLYVASGYRVVAQLDAGTGAVGWTTKTDSPVHAAPTVAAGKMYVADVDNQLLAFDAATGAPAWTYQALTEPARMMAASSPAVANETLVASFASGELVALRAANGNELWNESLSRASRTNALSEIRDIPGRPVIYKSDVFAVSHSNVFAATDLRTGTARWTLPISGVSTPWAAGDVVYVVSQAGEVICVSRENGQVYWIQDLNAGLKRKQRSFWSSPVLASNRLVTVSSKGEAVALNPKTGGIERRLKVGPGALIGPIAVGGMIYVATDKAELVAIR